MKYTKLPPSKPRKPRKENEVLRLMHQIRDANKNACVDVVDVCGRIVYAVADRSLKVRRCVSVSPMYWIITVEQ